MNRFRFASIVMSIVVIATVAFAQGGEMPPLPAGLEVIAQGFTGPQGVYVDEDGNVWVVDSGMGGTESIDFLAPGAEAPAPSPFGLSARVAMISPDGAVTDVALLPSVVAGTDIVGGARITVLDGEVYITVGQWLGGLPIERFDLMGAVAVITEDGAEEVANLWAFEEANNPDGFVVDTHPYGITAGSDGWLWVADAGANTLLRVNPETGEVVLVTAFDATEGVFPNPSRGGALEADPVPTGVAVDEDGNAYVSMLSGAPFIPGTASVMMVTPDGEVTPYAVGLTMLTDLQWGPDGELYAVQFGIFTQEGPVPNSGAILRIKEGTASEVVFEGIPFAAGLAFDADGNAYVTLNSVGIPMAGMIGRIDGLTKMEGTPLPMGAGN